MKGSYVLLLHLPIGMTLSFGRNRSAVFQRGHYAYVGSAMNGLEARVNRHLRKDKKRHWHIDYLLEHAEVTGVILAKSASRTECAIAMALAERFDSISGFGSSDCRCPSHLFFGTNKKRLRTEARRALKLMGLRTVTAIHNPLL
ncbi:MAG: GIY-YIG nuclease family protein [Chloroflexi bacterium]|nr:GIY-YIG nuclease family protein [Chloroflexota bacterium]